MQVRRAALRKKLRGNKRALIIPVIAIIIAGMVYLYIVIERNRRYDNLLNVDYFYEGVYVDDISLGGLTKDEAVEKLELLNKLRTEQVSVKLIWDGETIAFGADEVKIAFNTDEVLEEAWQEGRNGTDSERYDYVLSLAENPIYFTTEINVDSAPLEAKVKAVALFRERDPGEASVTFNPDPEIDGSEWFEYSEPQKGIETDPEGLWESVKSSLAENKYAAMEIPKWEVEPTTTIEDLKNMTQRIVQFKTHMVRNRNREHNVSLACSMINGTVLMPGEIFSMNDTTGKRTKAAGFKEANVIVGGNRLEPGIAGGVCQVSGTLFNAAVRADLEIVERYHHSFELSYLTRGRDATVNYGTADLRFKNTSDYPIYISMYTVGRDVYAEIYGMPLPDGMTIKLYVKTTRTIAPGPPVYVADSTVPRGTTEVYSAKTGIKCTTYKDYYGADGKLVDRVELHRDYYRPYAKEIHYNPASGIPAA
jgi:vancomycin resistance protein YoaR